jgi:hypothetical protein
VLSRAKPNRERSIAEAGLGLAISPPLRPLLHSRPLTITEIEAKVRVSLAYSKQSMNLARIR